MKLKVESLNIENLNAIFKSTHYEYFLFKIFYIA